MKKTMKVMAVLLCAIMMATVLSSCSKEDSYQNKVIGKWQVTRLYYHGPSGDEEHSTHGYLNVFFFDSNGLVTTGEIHENSLYQYNTYGYSISGDILRIGMNTMKIIELTNTTMVLDLGDDDSGYYVMELRKIQ